jgi:hypothetical protein
LAAQGKQYTPNNARPIALSTNRTPPARDRFSNRSTACSPGGPVRPSNPVTIISAPMIAKVMPVPMKPACPRMITFADTESLRSSTKRRRMPR